MFRGPTHRPWCGTLRGPQTEEHPLQEAHRERGNVEAAGEMCVHPMDGCPAFRNTHESLLYSITHAAWRHLPLSGRNAGMKLPLFTLPPPCRGPWEQRSIVEKCLLQSFPHPTGTAPTPTVAARSINRSYVHLWSGPADVARLHVHRAAEHHTQASHGSRGSFLMPVPLQGILSLQSLARGSSMTLGRC